MNRYTLVVAILMCAAMAQAEESPVVQAAKRGLAARRNPSRASIAVITDATLAKSTAVLTTSSGAAEIPDYTAKSTYAPQTSAVAATPATVRPVTYRLSTAGLDGHALLAAGNPCQPQISQNTSSGSPASIAQSAGRSPSSSSARPAQNSASDAPRMATNSSAGPRESENAGPNRLRRQ